MKIETVIIISTAAGLVVAFIATAVRYIRKSTANPEPEQPEPATITAKIHTAKPRPPKVVRAPEGCEEYLTAGKNYTVTSVGVYIEGDGYEFYTIDDSGDEIGCHEKESIHLNGGDWIVVEREGDGEKQQPSIEQQLTEAEAKVKQLEAELILTQNTNNHYLELIEETETERNEARALANDLREQLDRALVVIKDLEDVNGQLLAMVQGDHGEPEAKPLKLVTDLWGNECIHCPTEREAEAICKLMHEADMRWFSEELYKRTINWTKYKEETVYCPAKGLYGSKKAALKRGDIIHPASDFLPPDFYAEQQPKPTTTEPAIDWSKPVAFPEAYHIPKGLRVIVVDENPYVKIGSKGTIINTSDIPYIAFDGEKSNWAKNERSNTPVLLSERLAPLNPADHPLHPEFKGNVN